MFLRQESIQQWIKRLLFLYSLQPDLFGCGLHHVAYQHRGGHSANAAGHRGNGIHDGFSLGEFHVTAQLALFVHMDAHIHHGLALPQAVGTHGTHFAKSKWHSKKKVL